MGDSVKSEVFVEEQNHYKNERIVEGPVVKKACGEGILHKYWGKKGVYILQLLTGADFK